MNENFTSPDFYQIDDTTAFFTSSFFNGNKQVSEIFVSKKNGEFWDREIFKILNFENYASGNTTYNKRKNNIYFTLCDGFNLSLIHI